MQKRTLLWAVASPESVAAAMKNRWYLLGQYRVLAYGVRTGKVLQRADDAVAASLSEREKAWLATAIRESAELWTDWQEVAERQKEFMHTFEQELEAERRRAENGDGKADSTQAEAAGAESAGVLELGRMVPGFSG